MSAQRWRTWGLAASLISWLALEAWALPLSPEEVHVDLPVYVIREPADRLNERWIYRFTWSGIPVGRAAISVVEDRSAARPSLDIEVRGATNALADLFWKYRLSAHGHVRLDPFAPGTFTSAEVERDSEKITTIEFDEKGRVRSTQRKSQRVREYEFEAPNTFDMLSTVFLALNLDYREGEVLRFDTLTGTARYLVQVGIVRREPIEPAGEKQQAWRLEITSSELTNPEEEEKHQGTSLWVSAERPRRLLRARSKTFIGSIYVDLVAIEQLAPHVEERACGDGLGARRTPQLLDLSNLDLHDRIP